jgi:hypothetical protein
MPLKLLYDIIVTKITFTKIVLVANAHAGPSNNARPAFEMTAIALPARYALKPQLLYPYDDSFTFIMPLLPVFSRGRSCSYRAIFNFVFLEREVPEMMW